jgi:phage tail protein X
MRVVAETMTVTGESNTVDLIVWRKFRRPMPGYVEQVMDINPNLSFIIETLPVGTVLTLPAIDIPSVPQTNAVISLWS